MLLNDDFDFIARGKLQYLQANIQMDYNQEQNEDHVSPFINVYALQKNPTIAPYLNAIHKITFQNITYYFSFAEKYHSFLANQRCFLVISKDTMNHCQIGYVRTVKKNQFPFNPGHPIIEIKTKLKSISQNAALVDDKLVIPFYDVVKNEQEIARFIFKKPRVLQEWIKLISDLNGQQETQIINQIKMLKKENVIIDSQLTSCKKQLKQTTQSLKQKQKIICELQRCKNSIQTQFINFKTMQEATNQNLIKQCIKKNEYIQSKNKDLKLKQNELKSKEEELKFKDDSLISKDQLIQSLKDKNSQLQRQIMQLRQALEAQDIKHAEETKKNYEEKQKIDSQNAAHKQLLVLNSEKIRNLQTHAENQAKQLEILKINLKEIEKQKAQLHLHIEKLQQSHQQHNIKQSATIQQLRAEINRIQLIPLFDSILQGSSSLKQYLREQIQLLTSRKIVKTKSIYHYDSNNKTNFHRFIDGIPNIVLIIKTANDLLIAAYSQSGFDRSSNSLNKLTLILSLTNKKSFKLMQGKKGVTYDDYYLIFGNSQLQIRCTDLRLFTNFGLNSGFFDAKGHGSNILIGEPTNQIQMQTYELFAVEFA